MTRIQRLVYTTSCCFWGTEKGERIPIWSRKHGRGSHLILSVDGFHVSNFSLVPSVISIVAVTGCFRISLLFPVRGRRNGKTGEWERDWHMV